MSVIDIKEYSRFPKIVEVHLLLDLLQELGANIYHCNELFKKYWVSEMADEANKHIALAKEIKNRIISLVKAKD